MSQARNRIKDHQRIVVKVGSSSLTHPVTGRLDLYKIEILVRELSSLHNAGKDIILVSSGAIMVGAQALGLPKKPRMLSKKQACASVGQARLMMLYQKLFSEYSQLCSQILMTKHTMVHEPNRTNARNTFEELLDMNVIPIVNENDTISTSEIEFGDNDSLSAVVAALVGADLLILLSDIDGLFDDDPHRNPNANFISEVTSLDASLMEMAGDTSGSVGTGGMITKLHAASIASDAGVDMVIANAKDFHILEAIARGDDVGTLFVASPKKNFSIEQYLEDPQWKQ